MRQPQNAKRGRGRGRRGNGNNHHNHVPNRNTSYESNGPDVKLRGNAQQLYEKYTTLAHDAASAGERISAEAYTQFADHYFRLHQAAASVAETKKQQDQAVTAATTGMSPDPTSTEAASVDESSVGEESAVSGDLSGDAKPDRRRDHSNGKSAAEVSEATDSESTTSDGLSPAKSSEKVRDKAATS